MIEKEKNLEKKLIKLVKEMGGQAIKLQTTHYQGLPDRLCLFPNGILVFVEVKETGKKPTKIQEVTHKKLGALGFIVDVVDSTDKLNAVIAAATILSR